MTPRRAFTLVEMLVAITAAAVILLTTGTVIHSSLRVASTTNQALQRDRSLNHLLERLRRDVHESTSAAVTGGGDRLALSTADGHLIEFRFSDERVTRVVSDGREIAHRDQWRIPSNQRVSWRSTEDDRQWIDTILTVGDDSAAGATPTTRGFEQRMTTRVAADHRFRSGRDAGPDDASPRPETDPVNGDDR